MHFISSAFNLGPTRCDRIGVIIDPKTIQNIVKLLEPSTLVWFNQLLALPEDQIKAPYYNLLVASQLADSKGLLPLFIKNVWNCIENPQKLADAESIIINIFKGPKTTVCRIFLDLCSHPYAFGYDNHFTSLCSHFSQILPFSKALEDREFLNVPPYNQGGRQWLTTLITELKTSSQARDILCTNDEETVLREDKRTLKSIVCSNKGKLTKQPVKLYKACESLFESNEYTILFTPSEKNNLLQIIHRIAEANKALHNCYDLYNSEVASLLPKTSKDNLFLYIRSNSENVPLHRNLEADDLTQLIEAFKRIKENCDDTTFALISEPESYANEKNPATVAHFLELIEVIEDPETVQDALVQFFDRTATLAMTVEKLSRLKDFQEHNKYPEKSLEDVIQQFSTINEKSRVRFPIPPKTLEELVIRYKRINSKKEEMRAAGAARLIQQFHSLAAKPYTQEVEETLIAIIREMISDHYGIFPYNTQIIALLALLKVPESFKGNIAQICTGEGKSTVVTMFALMKAARKHRVLSISPTHKLSIRDQQKYAAFFARFNVKTSHICTHSPTKENYSGQILYGTNYDFKFAILRKYLNAPDQPSIASLDSENDLIFDTAIIDEGDSMLIDGDSAARLAIPGLQTYEWVYKPTLEWVRDNQLAVTVFMQQKDGQKSSLIAQYREFLGTIQNCKYADKLPKNPIQLSHWITSAYGALYLLKKDKDYVVMPVKQPHEKEAKDTVVIADKKRTGRLMDGNRWQHDQHEFLEVLNRLPISDPGLMPASLSNVVFFSKFVKEVFAVTGTAGSQKERDLYSRLFHLNSFDVPPHKPCLRELYEPIYVHTKAEHYAALLKEIRTMEAKGRPTLILFETIKQTSKFATFLKKQRIFSQLINERQSEEENFVVYRAGKSKMVTIATNAGGRGTDFILELIAKLKGGLHVIFATEPDNERAEDQGYGRGGRQGDPGSGRKILRLKYGNTPQKLKEAREKRLEKYLSYKDIQLSVDEINHSYLMPFLKKFYIWQSNATSQQRKVATKIQQNWAANFYEQLDDLWHSVSYENNALNLYKTEVAKLFKENEITWLSLMN